MIDHLLRSHLEPLVRRRWHLQFWPKLAVCWVAVGVLGLLLRGLFGPGSALPFIAVIVLGIASFIFVFARQRRVEDDWRWAARQVEAKHPELEGLLLTAAQQEPKGWGVLSYLQHKVVEKAIEHSTRHDWSEAVPQYRVGLAHAAHLIALVFCLIVVWGLRPVAGVAHKTAQQKQGPPGITVLPGDTVLERGSSLVVMARFEGPVPSSVELILGAGAGKTNRVELVRSLADPMFGGSVYEVDSDFSYHLEYAGQKTRDFNVKVFEYPKLEKANADLTYPAYTGQTNKHIEDTRRLSAVEGTRLELALQLNKPVISARLIAKGEETNTIALVTESNRPTATLPQFTLATSKTYQLQLVDADGRTNKIPTQFVFDVSKNRRPELKLASPRGDIRPSALEEVTFEGTAWDDFGVQAFGLAYTVAGQETKVVELGREVPAKQKRTFQFLLPLEDLGVKTDQLISYFVWADDVGADGQVRRTTGDLFFAEVRPFDEIFRQGEAQTREQQQQQQQREQQQSGEQGGQQNPSGRLAELQKQIISATWKLWRAQEEKGSATSEPAKKSTTQANAPNFINWAQLRQTLSAARNAEFMAQPAPRASTTNRSARARSTGTNATPAQTDAEVVRDSQQQALQQAEAAKQNAQDPRLTGLWETASKEMQAALDKLKASQNDPAKLQEALAAEQAAYQALLKLQEREYSVTRNQQQNRQNSRNQNSRQQQMQQQLDQLDLQQEENRYESERQAQAPQTQERNEQLQVQNRLQELARRQQDVNERLKELQTALQEARTEQEREEVRRQLKRLQEEEQQMMADADELQQRMDRAENQSRFSEQRQQLEQARQEMQRAAEAAQQSSASQALASGTRAERQLQEMRDQIRRQNASEFETDMRDMRAQARELARQEEEIRKDLDALQNPTRRTLSDADQRKEVLDQLAQQKQRLTNLVERATQLSQQTEEAEPLASRELYDSLRNFSQDEARSLKQLQEDLVNSGQLSRNLYDRLKETGERDNAKALEATSEMLRQGMTPQASQAEQRARESINNFRRGVERAAERVVGDDAETLRLAQRELDQLTQQLEREMAGSGTNGVRQGGSPNSQTNQQAQAGASQGQRGERGQGEQQVNNQNAQQPGQRGARGQGQPEGQQEQAQAGGEQGQPTPGQQQAGQRGARGQGRGQKPDGQPNGQGQGNPQEQQAMNNAQENPGQGQQGQRGRGATAARGQGNRGTNPRGTGAPVQEAGRGELAEGLDFLVQGNRTERGVGPITGNEFAPWSDRLREVEEMVDDPTLRNQVATARERARQMRQDFKRDLKKPDWAVVNLQVMKPLVEVRNQIAEELARREPKDKLVPIDRDPVPSKYSELVRRYYEQLGKDK